ncbi:MAG: DUF1963 domain-containing protein [Oscillospiraceae bacterium]|nr:DUF1963 domain-containing protein [Oscillospiraceae bacterium]
MELNETVIKIFKEIYDETAVECVGIELTNEKPSIFESKIGGFGYIPHNENFPVDSKGNQLRLLAQIECAKVEHPYYPKHGVLQFWIMNDDLYGADFDNYTKQDTFRIIYYKEIDKTVTEDEVKSKYVPNEYDADESLLPFEGEYGIVFEKCLKSGMTERDYRFESIFCEKYNSLNPDNPIKSLYDLDYDIDLEEHIKNSFGHKIGGYPAFTQTDPRENGDTHDFVLFQLDSDFGGNDDRIMWGDAGIGNFFINSEKLKNCDFSDVIYNWDCY